jgi:hypothetical protein
MSQYHFSFVILISLQHKSTFVKKLFFLFCLCLCVGQVNAQIRPGQSKEERTKTTNSQEKRFWFGGSLPLSLGLFGGTQLQLGASPMLGYKLTPQLSLGPRVGFLYNFFSVRTSNGTVDRAQPINWHAGFFARYKAFRTIFFQAEYEFENQAQVLSNGSQLEVFRINQSNTYIGAGLSQGQGVFKSEIMILYNLTPNANSLASPLVPRFGLTWHF